MVSTQTTTRKTQGTSDTSYTRQAEKRRQYVNVAPIERWISGIAGGALASYGVIRRDRLGGGLVLAGSGLVLRSAIGHSYIYQALNINTAPQDQTAATSVPHKQGTKVERAVTINASAETLCRYWRNFENLPNFMDHLKSVTVTDNSHSHWVAKAPAGTSVEWDAEI